jgi:hypothetical protein
MLALIKHQRYRGNRQQCGAAAWRKRGGMALARRWRQAPLAGGSKLGVAGMASRQ